MVYLHHVKYDDVKKNIRNADLLTSLFGLGWVFGLVATGFPGEDTEVLTFILQIFFCIVVGLQGVLIFFFNVVQLDEAKAVWKGWYCKLTKHLPSVGKYKVSDKRNANSLLNLLLWTVLHEALLCHQAPQAPGSPLL